MKAIIIGGGNVAYFTARSLLAKGHHITVIVRSVEEAHRFSRSLDGAVVMQGDGTSIQVLDDAGARNCDSFLAITPHDEDNLVGCQIASGKFGIPTVMATVNDPDNVDVFRALGIESVISTTDLISSVIEKRTRFDTVIQLLPLGSGKIIAAEVLLEEKSPATDRQIMDLELPPGVLIAAVERDGEIVIPKGDTLLRVYDHLTILCREESYAKAIRAVSEG